MPEVFYTHEIGSNAVLLDVLMSREDVFRLSKNGIGCVFILDCVNEYATGRTTVSLVPGRGCVELEKAKSDCNQKDRADYMTQCCDRERQRADDLEFPMRAIIHILDERCPNWRSRHIDHCDQVKAAYEVDFIVSEHTRLLDVISEYIRIEKEMRKELNHPWWKRLLRIK